MPVKKYRVFCSTESAFISGWSETEPTTCFNNNTHTIDNNQTTLTDIQLDDSVRIKQTYDTPAEGDSYFLYSKSHTIEPNSTLDLPIELEIECNMFSVRINTKRENIGDNWSAYINKNTIIGIVTASTDNTVVNVSSTEHVKIGYFISYDGINNYRVINKTDTTVTHRESVSVINGEYVRLTYYLVYKKRIIVPGVEVLGSSIIGSVKVPTNYTAGIIYENNSNQKKIVVVDVEITF
jgi:hypothetical protein